MFTRALMELDDDCNGVSGEVPEFGAIFISNTATKRECLRLKIFGLPSPQAYFVEQVKAGMVLFLFEFEKRMLYGVFQAQSDGAMNIAPQAYRSSGKQFPAQVPFSTIWNCSPLSEHEFRSAIKENYFSANKFNFGLSKAQVHRLLRLFSSRRLEDQLPQRQLLVNSATKPRGDSLGKVTRKGDEGGSSMIYRLENEQDVDHDIGPAILAKNSPIYSGKGRRIFDDGRFSEHETVRNAHNVDYSCGSSFLIDYPSNLLDEARKAAGDGRFSIRDKIASEPNVDNDVGAVNLSGYDGGYSHDVRGAADDIRLNVIDSQGSRHIGDNYCGPPPWKQHYWNYLGAEREAFDGCRSAMRDDVRNKCYVDSDIGSVLSKNYLGDSTGTEKRVAGDENFVTNGSVRKKHNVGSDPGLNVLTNYPRNFGGEEIVVGDDDHGYSVSYQIGDDGRKFAIRHSPSLRVTHGSSSAQKRVSPRSFSDGNFFTPSEVQSDTTQECISPYYKPGDILFPSFKRRSLPFGLEPDSINKCLDFTHCPGNNVSFPTHSPYEYSCFNSSGAGHFENKAIGSTCEDYKGASFSDSSVPPVHMYGVNENIGCVSYLSGLSKNLSLGVDYGYPFPEEDKFEHKISCEASQGFTAGASASTGSRCHLQGGVGSLQSIRCNEPNLTSYSFECSENIEGTCSDHPKSRSSVFSRLTLDPKPLFQKNDSYMGDDELNLDTSVDEIMEMLDSNYHRWVKMSKSKSFKRQTGTVENLRFKKRNSFHPRTGRDMEMLPIKMDADATPANEVNGIEATDETPVVNFKRRSELQKIQEENKIQDEIKAKGHVENAENEVLLSGQGKRRKLVRPNFT